ncbi:MAG TPA: hemolysin family protein [Thiopseudomonas sp.]|nr:hemolysin family protein [Thiopseudomonas sp.]
MYLEILIVVVLIALNGLLAMSELAVVSTRPARLKLRAAQGEKKATTALNLTEDQGRFLASVQIGISLVAVLSGAFSGATLGLRLVSTLSNWGLSDSIAQPLGIGLVVVVITYLSLIFGELVPKHIALRAPESVAMRVAPLMQFISKVAAPLIWLLDRSVNVVLRLIRQADKPDAAVSDEEIHMLIDEAEGAGVIEQEESQMIIGVMLTADRTARGILTPRHDVEIAEVGETRQQILERFQRSGHSRLPLRNGGPDDLIGVINARDVLTEQTEDTFNPLAVMKSVPMIHESLPAIEVIDKLRNSKDHMLLVFDDHGHFSGVITPMDILGAIAGGFDADYFDEPNVIEREDGSLLVSGWMPVDEFANQLKMTLEDDLSFETVAGLVIDRVEIPPHVGQHICVDGWNIEIVDMDGKRIDKLLVSKAIPHTDSEATD